MREKEANAAELFLVGDGCGLCVGRLPVADRARIIPKGCRQGAARRCPEQMLSRVFPSELYALSPTRMAEETSNDSERCSRFAGIETR